MRLPVPAVRRKRRRGSLHPILRCRAAICACLLLACAGCTGLDHGLLSPQGPVAGGERELFLIAGALVLVVIIPVFVLTPWVVWRYRRGTRSKARYMPDWVFSWPLEILAWGVPIVVVAVLGWFVWTGAHRLDPYHRLPSTQEPLEVQVVGLDWKWLFIYPAQQVASVDELAIPVGRPVHLTLTSDTVMQSLMIPRLAGQIYAMAGMRTQLYLQADRAGTYRGQNTQYNGEGFQRQKFRTLALPDRDFAAWVERARQSPDTLDCAAYAGLEKREVMPGPRHYRAMQPGLFDWIVARHRVHPAPACGSSDSVGFHG